MEAVKEPGEEVGENPEENGVGHRMKGWDLTVEEMQQPPPTIEEGDSVCVLGGGLMRLSLLSDAKRVCDRLTVHDCRWRSARRSRSR